MIAGLDHINIETLKLDESIEFYHNILGLELGPRPPFDVPGAWLYVGHQAIIHLVQREKVISGPTGAIHHVALMASNLTATCEKLDQLEIPYRKSVVPDLGVTQLFLNDPNDVVLELNFYQETKTRNTRMFETTISAREENQ